MPEVALEMVSRMVEECLHTEDYDKKRLPHRKRTAKLDDSNESLPKELASGILMSPGE